MIKWEMTITSKVDLRQAILDSLTFSSISILCCLCPSSCLSRRFAYSQSNSACRRINDMVRCHGFQFEMTQKKNSYCIKLMRFCTVLCSYSSSPFNLFTWKAALSSSTCSWYFFAIASGASMRRARVMWSRRFACSFTRRSVHHMWRDEARIGIVWK